MGIKHAKTSAKSDGGKVSQECIEVLMSGDGSSGGSGGVKSFGYTT